MSKSTIYEVVVPWRSETPEIVERSATICKKTVKLGPRPDVSGAGNTVASYCSTARIQDCDFTVADAWARFVAGLEQAIADSESQLEDLRGQLDRALAESKGST
jgi:hypothetical protein